MNQKLIDVAIAEVPAIIEWFRNAFEHKHPTDPPPSSENIIAAYQSAFLSSIAKDEAWLAAHPEV